MGWDDFQAMLDGAAAVDAHFRDTDGRANLPLRAAFADLFYSRLKGAQTRAVFAYDERLRLFPDYLQQLEMESNGKSVTVDGHPSGPTAPITWGGVGTDAQHAVFQLLHQGTHLIPVDFIASVEAGDTLDPAHHTHPADELLCPRRGADGGQAERRSAPQLPRQPSLRHDPVRRYRRLPPSARWWPSTNTGPLPTRC